ncbi:MAG: transglutaminase family protein [Proteobacteria bacterium]|nr:transglutaminase family protein [Pseudomonadota bacterium]
MPTTPSARYRVEHDTQYDYGAPIALSQQMLHLTPRAVGWQTVHADTLAIEPAPRWQREGEDAFGNPVRWLGHDRPHERLHVRSTIDVTVHAHAPATALADSPPWELVRDRLRYTSGQPRPAAELEACRFLYESPHVRIKREIEAYAEPSFAPGQPVLLAVQDFMHRMHGEFTFDPTATTIATPVLELLQTKRGVCQDYAHFMIACLRAMGLAARYVSGYLLTHPPPGRPRLVGADASHAWVAVWCPGGGESDWVAFDPTNDLLPGTEHITIAYGRDFSDVSPQRGVILGGGTHEPLVAVTVTPLDIAVGS